MKILWLFFTACTPDKVEQELDETIAQVSDWCAASLPGEQSERDFIHDFARMHMGQNLFGPEAQWMQNDANLATLIKNHPSFDSDFLHTSKEQMPYYRYKSLLRTPGWTPGP